MNKNKFLLKIGFFVDFIQFKNLLKKGQEINKIRTRAHKFDLPTFIEEEEEEKVDKYEEKKYVC